MHVHTDTHTRAPKFSEKYPPACFAWHLKHVMQSTFSISGNLPCGERREGKKIGKREELWKHCSKWPQIWWPKNKSKSLGHHLESLNQDSDRATHPPTVLEEDLTPSSSGLLGLPGLWHPSLLVSSSWGCYLFLKSTTSHLPEPSSIQKQAPACLYGTPHSALHRCSDSLSIAVTKHSRDKPIG